VLLGRCFAVYNGTLLGNNVPLDTKVNIILKEWNGTEYLLNCKYFIPLPNQTVYKCLTLDDTTDKIHCSRHKHKTRPYCIRSAFNCWRCALRHGYAQKLGETKTL